MIAFRAILTGWHSSRRPMPTMPAKRWRRSKLVMPSSWIGICGRVCLDPGPVIDRAAPGDFAGVLMFSAAARAVRSRGLREPALGGEVVVIGDEPVNTIKDRRRPRLLCRGAKESYLPCRCRARLV